MKTRDRHKSRTENRMIYSRSQSQHPVSSKVRLKTKRSPILGVATPVRWISELSGESWKFWQLPMLPNLRAASVYAASPLVSMTYCCVGACCRPLLWSGVPLFGVESGGYWPSCCRMGLQYCHRFRSISSCSSSSGEGLSRESFTV